MPINLEAIVNVTANATNISVVLPPTLEISSPTKIGDEDESNRQCHGVLYDVVLVVPAVLFVVYLAVHAKKNLRKLCNGSSYIMIAYYALLWLACLLNLAWCSLQAWQCSPGKEVAWNILSLFTTSAMLYLEICLVGFLLQESYSSGLETLSRTSIISGIIVGVDVLLKVIFVFGFGFPLFFDIESTHQMKWGLWIIQNLLLTAVYGFILFVHFPKWREKLPSRPAFYHYIIVMFAVSAVALSGCLLAGIGAAFGIWLYNLTVVCYHTLYLPFLFVTFLADFFQEEDFLLDSAYYSEMKDAGFFDADWE
ncbi:protein CANDIDATE G-PROTEIN COUPLED RECEPTOR 2-like [Mangifera indica]|uniref:protein CANDIDATE G-PROTEIN COUPLED RECEPTOR 2-like n=1 Tax=Mangifera indica TaxID=29780 RepID=UPI001CFA2276|nr:protein CANDIDATE G-PROTEIN COUPLED RECEPTOR 2-like [Mangifera indica]